MGYRDLEAQVMDWLRTTFSLDSEYVVAGDFDSLVKTLRTHSGSYGILVDYMGLRRDDRLGVNWMMRIQFYFRFTSEADVEGRIRDVADSFVGAIEGDSRLGGRVTTAVLVSGDPPEYVSRNREGFVSAPFTISVYELTRGAP